MTPWRSPSANAIPMQSSAYRAPAASEQYGTSRDPARFNETWPGTGPGTVPSRPGRRNTCPAPRRAKRGGFGALCSPFGSGFAHNGALWRAPLHGGHRAMGGPRRWSGRVLVFVRCPLARQSPGNGRPEAPCEPSRPRRDGSCSHGLVLARAGYFAAAAGSCVQSEGVRLPWPARTEDRTACRSLGVTLG
eukprot:scaffold442_cov397-Prasinococcus_capsulatus_cf.AAC.47